MKLHAAIGMIVFWLLSAADATAQEFFHFPESSGQFRTATVFYDNFFQEPIGRATRDVWAGLLELRLEETVGGTERLKAYTRVEYMQFRELGSSPGLIGGLKRRGRSQSFDVGTAFQWNRPRSDVGDELEQANLVGGSASYSYRVGRNLELKALAEYRVEFLKNQGTTDSRFHEYGGAVAYRVLRGRLTPEVGLTRGQRAAGDGNAEYIQDTASIAIRTTAIPRVNLSVRYRQRLREYLVSEPTSKNYQREDRRRNVTSSVDVSIGEHVFWNFTGGIDNGESTRPGRAFVAKSLGTGFTLSY